MTGFEQFSTYASALIALAFIVSCFLQGYATTLMQFAFWLKRHARQTQERQDKRRAKVIEDFVKEIELG